MEMFTLRDPDVICPLHLIAEDRLFSTIESHVEHIRCLLDTDDHAVQNEGHQA